MKAFKTWVSKVWVQLSPSAGKVISKVATDYIENKIGPLGLVRLHSNGLSPCHWNPIWKLLGDDRWRAQSFYLRVREFCIPASILPTNIDPKQFSLLAVRTSHSDITSQAVPRLQGGSDTGKYVHRSSLFPWPNPVLICTWDLKCVQSSQVGFWSSQRLRAQYL